MLIILSGLPGTGKTTIGRELAHRLDAVHVRIDSIEHAIRQSVVAGVSLDDAGYRVGYAVAEDNLRLGRTVIADSVNPLAITRNAWLAVAQRAGVSGFEIEVICSDPREHKRRVDSRAPDISGFSLPTWPEVVARPYDEWDRACLVIDTAHSSTDQALDTILAALAQHRR